MRQDSLLSLAALAVVPVVSYANAPVNGLSDAAKTAVTLKKGVESKVELGTFAPGKYVVKMTLDSEKTMVNGAKYDAEKGVEVTLTATGKIELAFKNDDVDNATVKDISLTHVYDYKTTHDKLMNQVTAILGRLNTAKESDKNGALGADAAALQTQLSVLMGKINTLVDGEEAAYKTYSDEELYTEPSKLDKEIADADAKVSQFEKDVKAADAKAAVKAVVNGSFKDAKDDAAKLDYWKKDGSYKTVREAIAAVDAAVAAANAAIDKAVEEGTITAFDYAEVVEDIEDAVGDLNDAIKAAKADDAAYKTLTASVTAATKNYTAASQAIQDQIGEDKDGIYNDTYKAALDELRVQINVINDVKAACGTDEAHEGLAFDAEDEDNPGKTVQQIQQAKLDGANDEIAAIKAKYVADIEAMQDAFAAANGQIKTLKENLAKIDVKNVGGDKFDGKTLDEYVAEINAAIAKLEGDVNAANKAHTIVKFDVATPAADIQKKIDALKANADKANNNYDANVAVGKLQETFDKAKAEVNALASGAYKVNGRYPDGEKDIQKAIDAVTKTVKDAIKDGKEVAASWKTDVKDAEDAIKAYQDAAKACVEKYDQVVEAIAKATADYNKLVETVTITSVKYTATGNTYADELAAVKKAIDDTQEALNKAIADDCKDAKHVAALNAITVMKYTEKVDDKDVDKYKLPVDATIAALAASYAGDLTKYNTDVVLNTAKTTLAETWARYEAVKFPDYTAAAYGKAATDLAAECAKIKAEYDKIEMDPKGITYDNVDDATKAIANLATVQKALDEIVKALGELDTKAKAAKALFDANNAAYDDMTANTKDKKGTITKVDEAYSKLPANKETGAVQVEVDDDTVVKYDTATTNAEAAAIKARLDALKADVEASKAAETLVADRADSEDADKKPVEGYDTRLAKINADIAALKAKIETANANKKAHDETLAYKNYKASGAVAVAGQKDKVAAVKDLDGDGLKYYNGLIDSYESDWDDLLDEIEENWLALNAIAEKPVATAAFDALVAKIKAIEAEAKADAAANKKLVALSAETKKVYDEAYLAVSSQDQSPKLQENLEKLAEYLREYNALDKAVKDAYADGTSAEKEADLTAALKALAVNIKVVKDYLDSDEYKAQVAQGNADCYADFLAQVAKTDEAYRNAVKLILELQEVKTVKLTELLDAANQDIYKAYAQAILDLKKKAEGEYEDTEAPAVYDSERKNIKAANDMTDAIKAAADELQAKADALAKAWVEKPGNPYAKAEASYNDAVADIKAAVEGEDVKNDKDEVTKTADQVKEETAKNALKDVKAILDAVNGAKGKTGYAQEVDGDAEDLATVDAKIVADKDAAAAADFAALLQKVQKQYADWRNVLAGYEYPDGTKTQDGLDALDKDYEPVAKVENETADFKGLADLKAPLKTFLAKGENTYKEYTNKAKNSQVNLDALKAMRDEIAKVQAEITAVKAFNDQFAALNKYTVIGNKQDLLDAETAKVDASAEDGTAWKIKTAVIAAVKNIGKGVEEIYGVVLQNEWSYLSTTQIEALKAKYNEAVAADALNDEQKQDYLDAIKAFADAIDANNAAWLNANDPTSEDYVDDDPDTKDVNEHAEDVLKVRGEVAAAYLKLEAEMAETLNEIANLADGQAAENALGDLLQTIDTWTSKLNNFPWHARTRAEFAEEMEAVNAAFEALAADVQAKFEAKSLLFHKANLEKAIEDEGKVLDALYAKMGARNDVFCANDAAYERLMGELADAEKAIADFLASIEDYDNVDADYEVDKDGKLVDGSDYGKKVYAAKNAIAADKKWIDEKNETGVELNAGSKLDAAKNVVADFAKYTVLAASEEAAGDNSRVGDKLKRVDKKIAETKLIDSDRKEYKAQYDEQKKKFDTVKAYYEALDDNFKNGKDLLVDIDGNELKEPAKVEDFKAEFNKVSAVMDTIWDALDALQNSVVESAYVSGDLNGDTDVDILDYTALLNLTLGKSDAPEEGTREFAAADSNGDGKINVADLQYIKQLIRGVAMAPRKAPMAAEGNDAITVTVDGNQLYIAMSNAMAYTALQMDIQLPSNVAILDENVAERAEGMSIANNDLNGMHRVVLHTLGDSTIEGNNGAVMVLTLSDNVDAADVRVKNAIASDAQMRAHELQGFGEATAIETIVNGFNSVKNSVYNMGGQIMDGLKKGVNIIRGNNGSSKKVVVK